jgi:hypothetical protein
LPPTLTHSLTHSFFLSFFHAYNNVSQSRAGALELLQRLLLSRNEDLTPLNRAMFFEALRAASGGVDTARVLAILAVLTSSGEDLGYIEFHVGPLLLELLPAAATAGCALACIEIVQV